MAKYSNTKAKINEKIATNGRQAVTGAILNDVLQTMVDSLGADYQFGGLVQPGSSFTAGEQPVVFLATTPGTYTNFGGLVVADGEVALLVWSGTAWSKQTPDIATRTEVSQLGQQVIEKTGGEYTPIMNLEQGSIGSDGADISRTDRLRTSNYFIADAIRLTLTQNRAYLVGYAEDGTYVGESAAWITSSGDYSIPGAYKYRFVFSNSAGSWIVPSDFPSLGISVKAVGFSDFVENDVFKFAVFNNDVAIGLNNSGKTYIRAIPGHTYRISPITKTWDITGISAYYAFAFGYSNDNGSSSIDVQGVLLSGFSGLYDHYDITLPSNATHLMVRAAGVPSTKIYFVVEDLTIQRVITPFSQTNVIQNGSLANRGNLNAVRTAFIPIIDKVSKYLVFHTNRPNTNGCEYRFAYTLTSSSNDLWTTATNSELQGLIKAVDYSINSKPFIENNINAVGIGICVAEYNISTGVINPLRASDFEGYTIFYTTSQNEEALLAEITNAYPSISLSKQMRNGSQGNTGNAYVITLYGLSTTAIPVSAGKKYRIVFDKLPHDGFDYYYRLVTYDTVSPSGLWDQSHIVRDNTNNAVPITTPIEIEDGEYGMSIQLTELDSPRAAQGSDGCIPLRIATVGEINVYEISQGITKDVYEDIDKLFKNSKYLEENVFRLNIDKTPMLVASCRNQKFSETFKDFQMLIVTDSHIDDISVERAITAANKFETIDALIHCGDYGDKISIEEASSTWGGLIGKSNKPCYFVIGNHEVGTYVAIRYSVYESQLYNLFIKPIVDKGWLAEGEYTVGKCYYYHDFVGAKTRLIVLNEYEAPHILDTDNPNWEAITYNSSLENYREGRTYTAGDEVNVNGYTDYSFRAKQSVTVSWSADNTAPSLKYRLGYRWIGQTQAQWFLDRLADTPSGYQIIVACHNPFSQNADVDQTKMFSQKNGWVNGYGMQNYMTTDFIAEAINALVTKNASFSIQCNSEYPSDMPSYSVSKDFSGAVATFHSLLGGHVHEDCVWKHHTYKQYQVTPICSNTTYWAQKPYADIRTINTNKVLSIANDSLTVVSYGENRIGLVKIGVNVTENGDKRDFEVIDTSI